MKIARVILDRASPTYDKEYDYLLPEQMPAKAGSRVLVPFGIKNELRLALILSVYDGLAGAKTKTVSSLIDESPILNDEGLLLLKMLHDTTYCMWFDAFRALIVPGAGLKYDARIEAVRGLETDKLSTEALKIYEFLLNKKKPVSEKKLAADFGLMPEAPVLSELIKGGYLLRSRQIKKKIADERAVMAKLTCEEGVRLTPKQAAVFNLLSQVGCASVKEVCYFTGVTRVVVQKMQSMGYVELFEEIVPVNIPAAVAPDDVKPIELSNEQGNAYQKLLNISQKGEYSVSLLHGVTGSGKTQVFLKLIEQTVNSGKSAIVLVPEISLTPQTVEHFKSRFGTNVAVLHSSLSMGERLDEFRRIKAQAASIVVGTRSAIFAPVENIGLIVIDEEQENTYHSESSPRYHARNVAKFRSKHHNAHLLICSATPSVESYHSAKQGKYNLVSLSSRYGEAKLPDVQVIDMRNALFSAFSSALSQELCEQLRETLDRREQAILLLNRRGYSTMAKCSVCGEVARCPHCSIPMTFHAANDRLICHYCNHSRPLESACESCESKMMRYTGVGTQKIEEELKEIYPQARILRMDMDTTMSKFSHERAFSAFAKGDYDIMIGTQMVAKGLDFPNVTLVGVLSADQSLYVDDFRGYERTFSLITQVIGRGGRSEKPGRAVIQTFTPENRILALAAAQDYVSFFKEENNFRRIGLYPPFCDVVCIIFSDQDEKLTAKSADLFCNCFVELAKQKYSDIPIRLLGPSDGSPYKVAGRFRKKLLIKCKNDNSMKQLLWETYEWYISQPKLAMAAIDSYFNSNF